MALRAVGGFDDTLKAAEDYDLWLRLAARASVAVLPEVLALVRTHPGQMSGALGVKAGETRRVIDRFLSTHPEIHRTGALRRRLALLAREEAYAALRAGERRARGRGPPPCIFGQTMPRHGSTCSPHPARRRTVPCAASCAADREQSSGSVLGRATPAALVESSVMTLFAVRNLAIVPLDGLVRELARAAREIG